MHAVLTCLWLRDSLQHQQELVARRAQHDIPAVIASRCDLQIEEFASELRDALRVLTIDDDVGPHFTLRIVTFMRLQSPAQIARSGVILRAPNGSHASPE
jgi:hypothetical protein